MKKFFNLIELTIVIAILGILASTVMTNVTDINKDAEMTAIKTNIRTLQLAVDRYSLDNNGKFPTKEVPKKEVPQPLELEELMPTYIRNLPNTKSLKYWVDYQGKVWVSSVDSPVNINYRNGKVSWDAVLGAISYNIYEVEGNPNIDVTGSLKRMTFVRNVKSEDLGSKPEIALNPNKIYLISAIDVFNLESAPAGKGYEGYNLNMEGKTKPVAVIKMTPEQGVTINTTVIWESESYHPQELSIVEEEWEGRADRYPIEGLYTVRLRVKDENGVWSNWAEKSFYVINPEVIKDIAVGHSHTLIIKNDNSLWGFGSNEFGQLGTLQYLGGHVPTPILIMEDVEAVSAGAYHTLVKKTDNSLWAFGHNYYGQLGVNKNIWTDVANHTPVKVLDNVKTMAAGEYYSLVVKNNNELWGFGNNRYGQLGIQDNINMNMPNPIPKFVMSNVRDVSAGNNHSLIIKTDNTLWACGNNHYNQYGDATGNRGQHAIAPPVFVMNNVKMAVAGHNYSLILKLDSTLWSVGDNKWGQLGNKEASGTGSTVSNPVYVTNNVKYITAGGFHSLIIKKDNSLWSFGSNRYGELGHSIRFKENKDNYNPIKIMDNVIDVATGLDYTIVIKDNFSVVGFGRNNFGQLGNPQSPQEGNYVPVVINIPKRE